MYKIFYNIVSDDAKSCFGINQKWMCKSPAPADSDGPSGIFETNVTMFKFPPGPPRPSASEISLKTLIPPGPARPAALGPLRVLVRAHRYALSPSLASLLVRHGLKHRTEYSCTTSRTGPSSTCVTMSGTRIHGASACPPGRAA